MLFERISKEMEATAAYKLIIKVHDNQNFIVDAIVANNNSLMKTIV